MWIRTMRRPLLAACAATTAVAATAVADVPEYNHLELQCRSNFGTNPGGSYNLPGSSFFNSGTPDLNNNGEVVIRLQSISGDGARKGLFFGSDGNGGIVWEAAYDSLISDASINNNGYVVVPQTFSSLNGVYYYDDATEDSGFLTNDPLGTSGWSSPTVNDDGDVSYRINFSGSRAWYSYSDSGGAYHVQESGLNPNSDYDFLFTPAMNNNREIAGKAQRNSGGNDIILADADGHITIIASDSNADPKSPYAGFSNSVSLTDDGRVAFNASLVSGGRGIFLSDGDTTVEIVTTAHPDINEFEFFTAAVNNNGLVVLRVVDSDGNQAIVASDGTELRRVVTAGDQIEIDAGLAQVGQHDDSPVFGGSPSINDNGDIAFNAGLTPHDDDQIEWGSGVFIAYAQPEEDIVGDLNDDGTVNVSDMLLLLGDWGECPRGDQCPADLNDDGSINVSDLLLLLGNWG